MALTLRTIAGVPTADIARAFLVTESTMTRRLTRAKTRIADAGIPYRVPSGPALTERLPGVLAVLYLLFTQGYNADGEPAFADEAIRLARLLDQLMPGPARDLRRCWRCSCSSTPGGTPAATPPATCSPWTSRTVPDGTTQRSPKASSVLERAPVDGPYAMQARIAACHATAAETRPTGRPSPAGTTIWSGSSPHR